MPSLSFCCSGLEKRQVPNLQIFKVWNVSLPQWRGCQAAESAALTPLLLSGLRKRFLVCSLEGIRCIPLPQWGGGGGWIGGQVSITLVLYPLDKYKHLTSTARVKIVFNLKCLQCICRENVVLDKKEQDTTPFQLFLLLSTLWEDSLLPQERDGASQMLPPEQGVRDILPMASLVSVTTA